MHQNISSSAHFILHVIKRRLRQEQARKHSRHKLTFHPKSIEEKNTKVVYCVLTEMFLSSLLSLEQAPPSLLWRERGKGGSHNLGGSSRRGKGERGTWFQFQGQQKSGIFFTIMFLSRRHSQRGSFALSLCNPLCIFSRQVIRGNTAQASICENCASSNSQLVTTAVSVGICILHNSSLPQATHHNSKGCMWGLERKI